MTQVGIIGAGGIAKHLQTRLQGKGHQVAFVLRRETFILDGRAHERGGRTLRQILSDVPGFTLDAMFLAISTLDQGEAARDYILDCAAAGIPVITCEKGALSRHAEALKEHGGLLRYTAAVGGGTQMLTYLQNRDPNKGPVDIYAVINGTLNYIFNEVAHAGRTLGEACDEAIQLGYAEPGAHDPLSLINAELRDVTMKTSVVVNTTLARRGFITPEALGAFKLMADQPEELSQEAAGYRVLVLLSNRPTARSLLFFPGSFKTTFEGWHIEGGFCKIHLHANFMSWLPGGVGNAVHVVEGDLGSGGRYTLSGPGAGHEPTTTAMLNDLYELVK